MMDLERVTQDPHLTSVECRPQHHVSNPERERERPEFFAGIGVESGNRRTKALICLKARLLLTTDRRI